MSNAHKKRKKAIPSLLMRYRIAYVHICIPLTNSILHSPRCHVDGLLVEQVRSSRNAKISSPEVGIWRQRCERQRLWKSLVNSGSGASDGVLLATSDGRSLNHAGKPYGLVTVALLRLKSGSVR